ncbi:peptide ABC transporter ATP-binding protein, partial [Streptococcus pneumoniae]
MIRSVKKWDLPIWLTRRKEMSEKLVEIKDLEISFGEGSKKFVAVKNANFFIN